MSFPPALEPTIDTLSPTVSPQGLKRREPISIQFLLAWSAGTALILILFGTERFVGGADPHLLSLSALLQGLPISMVYGACLATWLYLGKRWMGSQYPFPFLGGHWLCLLAPAVTCAVAAEEFAVGLAEVEFLFNREHAAMRLIRELFLTVVWLVPLLWRPVPYYWNAYFAARALIGLLNVGAVAFAIDSLPEYGNAYLPSDEQILLQLAASALEVVAFFAAALFALIDLRRRHALDWQHWLGVGATVGLPLFLVAIRILANVLA